MLLTKLKKSQESPVSVIVIIILGVLVAAAGTYFIYSGRSSYGSIDLSNAKSTCEIACFKISETTTTLVGEVGQDFSCPYGVANDFCRHSFLVGGRDLKCYELTDCIITLSSGKSCKVSSKTCFSD